MQNYLIKNTCVVNESIQFFGDVLIKNGRIVLQLPANTIRRSPPISNDLFCVNTFVDFLYE